MSKEEHLYIVAYDIGDPKRWRQVFRIMNGYGEWLQLSIFQCRLTAQRHAELIALLDGITIIGKTMWSCSIWGLQKLSCLKS